MNLFRKYQARNAFFFFDITKMKPEEVSQFYKGLISGSVLDAPEIFKKTGAYVFDNLLQDVIFIFEMSVKVCLRYPCFICNGGYGKAFHTLMGDNVKSGLRDLLAPYFSLEFLITFLHIPARLS